MTEEKMNQWHPAFYAALHLELAENKHELIFEEEHILNTLPLRVDALVIKKECECEIKNEIGKFFRMHNLVEFKSPDDALNFNTFLKGIAYCLLYKNSEEKLEQISYHEITLSFIRERRPIQLLKRLEKEKFLVEEKYSGIYYISKEGFIPVQIVVGNRLNSENHIWLTSMTNRLTREKAVSLADETNKLEEWEDINFADSVWEIVTTQNRELILSMREDESMCKALAEIMKPEFDAAVEEAVEKAVEKAVVEAVEQAVEKTTADKGVQVFKNMITRGFSREAAQSIAEISDELVERALAEI